MSTSLVLGWRVDEDLRPTYWVSGAKPGAQPPEELVTVDSSRVAAHTAIIAQSGSGKSTLLARLLEEILLNTRARCLIIDPNSDFRRFNLVEDPELWNKAAYDGAKDGGRLPHEATQADFRVPWRELVSFTILMGEPRTRRPYQRLSLWWPALNMDLLAGELGSLDRAQLYQCHRYVQALADLAELRALAKMGPVKLLTLAESVHASVRPLVRQPRWRTLVGAEIDKTFPPKDIAAGIEAAGNLIAAVSASLGPADYQRSLLQARLASSREQAVGSLAYFDDDVARFYFGRISELSAARVLADESTAPTEVTRVSVLDLPSLPERRLRLLAINSILNLEFDRARNEWKRAAGRSQEDDERVPTFIVVDEAHNVIPSEPTDDVQRSIREQFRAVVAEGRKYGLFLIVASQRPDRIDEVVVGECENRAVMRLNSVETATMARRIMGLDDIPRDLFDRTLDFGVARTLLAGRWSPKGAQVMYAGARRTIEGGRNLRSEYWASRPDPVPKKPSTRAASSI